MQSLYSRGLIIKQEMAKHPYKNKIHNCIGCKEAPKIELSNRIELVEGDIILLCTDGLWGSLKDTEIKKILKKYADVTEATNALMDAAEKAVNEHGDNLSAITLQWGDKKLSNDAVSTQQMPFSETTTIINPVTHRATDGFVTDAHAMDEQVIDDFSDEDIEKTLAEIQAALLRTKQKTGI